MQAIPFVPKSVNPEDIKGVKILDSRLVEFEAYEGIDFTGISDLAYDGEGLLYALSDKGYLFRLELLLDKDKIGRLVLKGAYRLKNKEGKPLSKKRRDAEGLDFFEGTLLISFERKPKVSQFDLTGVKIKNLSLPLVLEDIKNYQGKNSALESVVMHPDFGVITVPQRPLKHTDDKFHTLFSLEKRWRFKADADITAIETMPDGSLLVLEREFRLFGMGHTVWLKKVPLKICTGGFCQAETLAKLDSTDGWKLDNFEGLVRIDRDRYLMISDDNGSFLQKCIVVLFQVK